MFGRKRPKGSASEGIFVHSAAMVLKLPAANCHPHTGKKISVHLKKKSRHCCFQGRQAVFHASGMLEIKRNSRNLENTSSSSPLLNSPSVLTSGSQTLLHSNYINRASEARARFPSDSLSLLSSCVLQGAGDAVLMRRPPGC